MADTKEEIIALESSCKKAFADEGYGDAKAWANGETYKLFRDGFYAARRVLKEATPPADAALTCDKCGALTNNPWHGSEGDNRHVHYCDACYAALRARSPQASDAALIGKLRHQLAQVTEECAALRARSVTDAVSPGYSQDSNPAQSVSEVMPEGFERVAWQRVSDDGNPLPIFVTLREHLSPVCQYREVLAASKGENK